MIDARTLNWRFVLSTEDPASLLLLPIGDEKVAGATVSQRSLPGLEAALERGPFRAAVLADVASWQEATGLPTAALVEKVGRAVTDGGSMYMGLSSGLLPFGRKGRRVRPKTVVASVRSVGFTKVRLYFALPHQRCPAYLVSGERRAELDYFLKHLFFPYTEAEGRFRSLLLRKGLQGARRVAPLANQATRLAVSPATAVVATRA